MEFASVLLLVILFSSSAAFEPRCYYDTDKLAPDDIIPCYKNDNEGHFACCRVGNKCLAHDSCYDSITGVTYQYGCTDPSYKNAKCPQKCGLDRELSHWAGLVYCDGSDGTPKDTWLCHHPENCGDDCDHKPWNPDLERPRAVTCKDLNFTSDYQAFKETSIIQDFLFLPTDSAGVSSYFSQYGPTTTNSHSSTASLSTGTGTGTSAPSTTPSTEPHKKDHSATYIALGVCIPFLLVLIGAVAFLLKKRREAKRARQASDRDNSDPGFESKSELPADERPVFEMHDASSTVAASELQLSPRTPHSTSTALVSPLVSEFSDQDGRYEHRASEIQSNPIHELPG